MRIFRQIVVGIVLLTSFAVLVGMIGEQVIRNRLAQRFPMPGEMVDVGGHSLHHLAMGEGDITIVFESGLDATGHVDWYPIQEKVSQLSRTVSYDRAGILFSERGKNPKTAEAIAVELRTLLKNGGYDPPFLLVGHSFAGVTLRSFVDQYPDEIVGIVFVDVAHPDERERMLAQGLPEPPEESYPAEWVIELAFATGLTRLILGDSYWELESSHYMNQITNGLYYKGWRAALEEGSLAPDMRVEVGQIQSFGDIPLVVITGVMPGRFAWIGEMENVVESTSNELQEELLDLSTDSKWVLANESEHFVQITEPDLIVSEIEALLRRVESGR
ncbi:MAG: alpha/beta hydrolase [Chloroflexota bacterium]